MKDIIRLHTAYVSSPAAGQAKLRKPTHCQPAVRYTGAHSNSAGIVAAAKATSPVSPSHAKQDTQSRAYKGISRVTKKGLYKAVINIAGKRHHIGYFPDELSAAKAYDLATLKLMSEGILDKTPLLNFPDSPYTEEEVAAAHIPSLKPTSRSGSELKGVSTHQPTGRWQASIFYNGSNHHLGYYGSEKDAAKAYDNEVRRLEQQGMLRRARKLNFPDVASPVTVPVQENQEQQHSSSKYKGVCWDARTNRWRAQMWYSDKTHSLGQFDVEQDAAKAYDAALLCLTAEGRLAAGVRPLNFSYTNYSKETIMSAKVPSDTPRQISSTYYGVSWHRPSQQWRAQMWTNGTLTYLGLYNTAEDAAMAYDNAVMQALAKGQIRNARRLNFPGGASKPGGKEIP